MMIDKENPMLHICVVSYISNACKSILSQSEPVCGWTNRQSFFGISSVPVQFSQQNSEPQTGSLLIKYRLTGTNGT